MKLLSYLFRQSWWLIAFAALTGVASGLSGAGLAAVIGKGVSGSQALDTLVGAFFGFCLAHLVLKTTSEIAVLRLAQTAIANLRLELSGKLLQTPQKRLQELGKSRLLVILTRDIDMLAQAAQLMPVAFGDVIIILACLGYMAWLSLPVFVTVVAVLLGGTVVYHFAERAPLRMLSKARAQTDVLYQHFRGLIDGSRELQLNDKRSAMFIDEVIGPEVTSFRHSMTQGMTRYVAVANVGTIFFYGAIGLVLFQIPFWQKQSFQVSTTITLILLYLIRPIADLVGMVPMIRQSTIALKKIEQLEDALTETPQAAPRPDPFVGTAPLRLSLRQVCHTYTNDRSDREFVLGPLDLTITQGEVLFVVGGNGTGKTTLAMLLLGLYEPESGEIHLNGTLVTAENRRNYRQYFSVVFADFHLFEHLLQAESPELIERLNHYLKLFGMEDKVKVEDGRFSTINLSSGQRKRLALLSTYLEDRPIYLFDEWAADQDPTFKRIFYTQLLPELKARGKTVIAITHDDAYFSCADRALKIENGRFVGMDPHPAAIEAPRAVALS